MVQKERESLTIQNEYVFSSPNGKERCFKITELIGYGASCIVYGGYYKDEIGLPFYVKIKECFPRGRALSARVGNNVQWNSEAEKEYAQNEFEKMYRRHIILQSRYDFINSTCKVADVLYSANNTKYLIMEFDNGTSFDKAVPDSLFSIFKTIRALALTVQKYHEIGLLHLDIKPQNFMVIPETEELVKLFDFDSLVMKDEITKGIVDAIAYTNEWAAPEVKQGKIKRISEAADVYSIGAVLFYAVFGRMISIDDIGSMAKYRYEDNEKFDSVNPMIKKKLSYFFRNTLSINYRIRFKNMREVITVLDEMIELTNPKAMYLTNRIPSEINPFVGRAKELKQIDRHFENGEICIVSGIGGIGKSELAMAYARKNASKYSVIVYSRVKKNVLETIGGSDFLISNYRGEDDKDKFHVLTSLVDESTLIVLDDLKKLDDPYFLELTNTKAKILVTTRVSNDGIWKHSDYLRLDTMSKKELLDVFKSHYAKSLFDGEDEIVENMINIVHSYTLVIPLLAKQMNVSGISVHEMYEKMSEAGILSEFDERVTNYKNENVYKDTMYNQVKMLFDMSVLGEHELLYIKALSLLQGYVINRKVLSCLCSENFDAYKFVVKKKFVGDSLETINQLIELGWVMYDCQTDDVHMHDMICEVVRKEIMPGVGNCRCFFDNFLSVLNVLEDEYFKNRSISGINKSETQMYLGLVLNLAEHIVIADVETWKYFVEISEVLIYLAGEGGAGGLFAVLMYKDLEKFREVSDSIILKISEYNVQLKTRNVTSDKYQEIINQYFKVIDFANKIDNWDEIFTYENKNDYLTKICGKYSFGFFYKLDDLKLFSICEKSREMVNSQIEILEEAIHNEEKDYIVEMREKEIDRRRTVLEIMDSEERILTKQHSNKINETKELSVRKEILNHLQDRIIHDERISDKMKLYFCTIIIGLYFSDSSNSLFRGIDNEFLELHFPQEQWEILRRKIRELGMNARELMLLFKDSVIIRDAVKDLSVHYDILDFVNAEDFDFSGEQLQQLWKCFVYENSIHNVLVNYSLVKADENGIIDLPEEETVRIYDENAVQAFLFHRYRLFLKYIVNYFNECNVGIIDKKMQDELSFKAAYLPYRLEKMGQFSWALKLWIDIDQSLEKEQYNGMEIASLERMFSSILRLSEQTGNSALYYKYYEKRQRYCHLYFSDSRKIVFDRIDVDKIATLTQWTNRLLGESEKFDMDELISEENIDEECKRQLLLAYSQNIAYIDLLLGENVQEVMKKKNTTVKCLEEVTDSKMKIVQAASACFDECMYSKEKKELMKYIDAAKLTIEGNRYEALDVMIYLQLPQILYQIGETHTAYLICEAYQELLGGEDFESYTLQEKVIILYEIKNMYGLMATMNDKKYEDQQKQYFELYQCCKKQWDNSK